MNNLLKFYGRQLLIPIFVIVAAAIMHQVVPKFYGSFAIAILFGFVYKWNVAEKTEKTWRFFHSLPIGFLQKAVLKVFIPFGFSFLVWISSTKFMPLLQLIEGQLNHALVFSSALVLASLIANGLVSFLMWLSIVAIIGLVFKDNGPMAVTLTTIYLAAALVFLSEKRLLWRPMLLKSLAVIIPLALIIHYSRIPTLNFAMKSSNNELVLTAADQLIERGQENNGLRKLGLILSENSDGETILRVIKILDNRDMKVDLPKTRWLELLAKDRELRSTILDYVRHQKDNFAWLNIEVFQIIEVDIHTSTESCRDDCRALARLVGELAIDNKADADRFIRSRLSSTGSDKVMFGLHAAQFAKLDSYKEEILKLLEHDTKIIRTEAQDLLKEMVENPDDLENLDKFLESVDADLTSLERKKLQDIIRDIVIPNLIKLDNARL